MGDFSLATPSSSKRAENKRKKAAILACVEKYQQLFNLDKWGIEVKFPRLKHTADCEAWPHYKQVVLQFDLRKIDDDIIDEIVVHEMLHCHIWELAAFALSMANGDPVKVEIAEKLEEALTTAITEIFIERSLEDTYCARCSQAVSSQKGVGTDAQGGKEASA